MRAVSFSREKLKLHYRGDSVFGNFVDMATASSVLSEDKFLCSVCLDVFTEPVSTPCGHNFCRGCIHKYWDKSDVCQCPLCMRTFASRPELHVNSIMSELAAQFSKMVQLHPTPNLKLPKGVDVLCDICLERRDKAVKSCLVCLTSFCQAHLEPHHRVYVLKNHKLVDPVHNLDENLCQDHGKLTELYCRTDQAFICVLCFKTNHKRHTVVPLEEQYEAMMLRKDEAMASFQRKIQSRCNKIKQIENSLVACQKGAEEEKKATVQLLDELVSSLLRSQAEVVEVIEERHSATKQKAEGFLKELRTEVEELKSASSRLEQLSKSEDHHCFVKNFSTSCPASTKDWITTSVHSNVNFGAVRVGLIDLIRREKEITETIPEIKMRRIKEHAVDVTLDPDTAHCLLFISPDRKQVSVGTRQSVPNNPKRFVRYIEVLGKEGFTQGKSYFEVQVKGKSDWALGVVRESIDRKGDKILSVTDGYWTIGLEDGKCQAYEKYPIPFTLREPLQTVGIFVDYEKGTVSFYDALSSSHLYSFSGHRFAEKLFPYFSPHDSKSGTNSAPLVITPVPQAK